MGYELLQVMLCHLGSELGKVLAILLVGSVAMEALVRENRTNVPIEIDALFRK